MFNDCSRSEFLVCFDKLKAFFIVHDIAVHIELLLFTYRKLGGTQSLHNLELIGQKWCIIGKILIMGQLMLLLCT